MKGTRDDLRQHEEGLGGVCADDSEKHMALSKCDLSKESWPLKKPKLTLHAVTDKTGRPFHDPDEAGRRLCRHCAGPERTLPGKFLDKNLKNLGPPNVSRNQLPSRSLRAPSTRPTQFFRDSPQTELSSNKGTGGMECSVVLFNRASICSRALILLSPSRWIVMTGWRTSISLQPLFKHGWFVVLVVYKHQFPPCVSNMSNCGSLLHTRISIQLCVENTFGLWFRV